MGLLDAIPGLAAHQTQESVAVPQFDTDQACRLISDALSLISSLYPEGALEWLREYRRDVTRFISESEIEINEAALAGDRGRLVRALETWSEAHKRAFALFQGRPPVIERQEQLFEGAA